MYGQEGSAVAGIFIAIFTSLCCSKRKKKTEDTKTGKFKCPDFRCYCIHKLIRKKGYGKNVFWYVVGTVISSVTFFMMFSTWEVLSTVDFNKYTGTNTVKDNVEGREWYFIYAAFIFNFGLACIEISHKALLNSLTKSKGSRRKMNIDKEKVASFGSIFVFGSAAMIFLTVDYSVE